jgi:hypothetical protein
MVIGASAPIAAATALRKKTQFRLALDVELSDAALKGRAHLRRGFADAGEDDLLARHARRLGAGIFTARDHVHPRAKAGECLEHRHVGVGLHRVADQMRQACQRLLEDAVVAGERGGGIDVDRRADLGGNLGDGHVFGVERATPVEKMIHQSRGLERRKR